MTSDLNEQVQKLAYIADKITVDNFHDNVGELNFLMAQLQSFSFSETPSTSEDVLYAREKINKIQDKFRDIAKLTKERQRNSHSNTSKIRKYLL